MNAWILPKGSKRWRCADCGLIPVRPPSTRELRHGKYAHECAKEIRGVKATWVMIDDGPAHGRNP